MLHDLDLLSAQEVRSRTGKAYEAGQSCNSLRPNGVDCRADASAPSGSSIRDTVAGVVEPTLLERRVPSTADGCSHPSAAFEASTPPVTAAGPIVHFVCDNDVLAVAARDGKMLIGSRTIVQRGARNLAARRDVLVPAQR